MPSCELHTRPTPWRRLEAEKGASQGRLCLVPPPPRASTRTPQFMNGIFLQTSADVVGYKVEKVCFFRLSDVKGCNQVCKGREVGEKARWRCSKFCSEQEKEQCDGEADNGRERKSISCSGQSALAAELEKTESRSRTGVIRAPGRGRGRAGASRCRRDGSECESRHRQGGGGAETGETLRSSLPPRRCSERRVGDLKPAHCLLGGHEPG